MTGNGDKVAVSVIVPVYKVEAFIGRCIRSLMEQTLREVEFIIVDDCSPDRSIAVAEAVMQNYPERHAQVRLIRHEVNKGLPAARNTGLAVAKGEYVFHCDSDDFIEPVMLEKLYDEVKRQDADIVWCDWMLSFGQNERYMKQPDYGTPMEALKGMLSGVMKYNVWNKLVRRQLYVDNQIQFPAGYGMGEDMTMIRLFASAQRVTYVSGGFYHYVKLNAGAFSKTYSNRHLEELRHNTDETLAFLKKRCGNALALEMEFFKLDVKYPFLITDDRIKHKLWSTWYPEANRYITSNKEVSFRRRVLQLLAAKKQFWLVRLYYKMVHKLIYGIIYR